VVRRPALHEVRARLANLRAVSEETNVFLRRVRATFGQAVLDGGQADLMACRALLNALLHFAARVGHGESPGKGRGVAALGNRSHGRHVVRPLTRLVLWRLRRRNVGNGKNPH
jgi:hypothetical protein